MVQGGIGIRYRRLHLYIFGVAAVGFASGYVLRANTPLLAPDFIFFSLLAVGFALFPIPVSKDNDVIFLFPLTLAVIVTRGPFAGTVVTVLAILVSQIVHKKPWEKILFNTGNLALASSAAGYSYLLMGQSPGATLSIRLIVVVAVLSAVQSIVNFSLLIGLMTILEPGDVDVHVKNVSAVTIKQAPFEALVAILFLAVYQTIGRPGLGFLAVLLVLFRYGSQAYFQLQSSYEEVQSMLISILDGRDAYTAGHSQRVADSAVAIARDLRLPSSEIENIRRAGLLHDIGKVNVPDEVLKKPGKLSEDETRLMNQHPVDGARFVERVSSLRHLAPVIRHHHERYDGRGYPDGLSGEAVPLGARVLLVADAFDAMTTDRPYRVALSKAEALGRIITNAGTQFDARVALAALRVLGKDLAESSQLEAVAEAAASKQDREQVGEVSE